MSHVRAPMVDLSGADLRESDFMGAMLRRANLSGCFLNPIHMYRADLREADLSKSLMNRANLRGADLRTANLEGADLDSAILSDANLTGASLKGANLSRNLSAFPNPFEILDLINLTSRENPQWLIWTWFRSSGKAETPLPVGGRNIPAKPWTFIAAT